MFSQLKTCLASDKYLRGLLGFGLFGSIAWFGLLVAPETWTLFLGGSIGSIWLFFGLYRLFVYRFDFRRDSLVRARLATLLLALYAASICATVTFIHPVLPSAAAKAILQVMTFLCVALDLVMVVNPDGLNGQKT